MATAEALDLWEPRIELVRAGAGDAEFVLIDADGTEIPMPLALNISSEGTAS